MTQAAQYPLRIRSLAIVNVLKVRKRLLGAWMHADAVHDASKAQQHAKGFEILTRVIDHIDRGN